MYSTWYGRIGKFILNQEMTALLESSGSENGCILFSSLRLNTVYQDNITLYLYEAIQKKAKKKRKKVRKRNNLKAKRYKI